ncbi:MAG: PKD domain-containing protein, partial [Desulfobacteraceae bacterium]|nr:PKD domain-containing protein [Desulfobacteraceae bacterium]
GSPASSNPPTGTADGDTFGLNINFIPTGNSPPTAVAKATPTSATANETITLDGSESYDTDGTIVKYAWDFGDGSIGETGDQPSHTYASAGTYTVTLTVTDDDEATGMDTCSVTINDISNIDPTAVATANPTSALVNETVTLDGSGSSDTDGTIVSYAWNQTAGTTGTFSDPAIAEPTFTVSAGTAGGEVLTFELTVTDDDGATGRDTCSVTVINQAPNPPEQTAPLNGSTDVSLMPELITGAYSDPNNDPHAMTQWQVATDQLFDGASLVYNEETGEYLTSVFVPPNLILEAGTTYYWRARFNDGTSWSDYSVNWSFTTIADGATFVDGVNDDDLISSDDDKLLGEDFVDDGEVVNTDTIKSFKSKVDPTVQIGLKSETAGVVIEKCGSADPNAYAAYVDTKVPAIPFGLIEVALTNVPVGGEAEITVYYSEALPANFTWWKFDPNKGEFYDYQAAHPEIADLVVVSEDKMSVTVKFKDGEYGDLVSTPGGKIIDPSGPGGESSGGHHSDSCFISTVQE